MELKIRNVTDENVPVLWRQQVLLDELVGDILGYKVHSRELEGDGLFHRRFHFALNFETRLDFVDVQNL